jgi:hypothetical protein
MNRHFNIEEFISDAKELLNKPASEAFTPFVRPTRLNEDPNFNTILEPLPQMPLRCMPQITFEDSLAMVNEPLNMELVKQEGRLKNIEYLIDANEQLQQYLKMEQYERVLLMSNILKDKLKRMKEDEK